MMSTAVLKSVGQATHYYTDNGNYYADDAKGNSQWYGKGADKLGLAGDVDIEAARTLRRTTVIGNEKPRCRNTVVY